MVIGSFSSVQLLSLVQLFATPWTAACQASLSITKSQSLLKLMSIELVMPSNHLILYHPLLLLPSIFPSIKVFSNESALHIKWPKHWSFSFNISPSNEYINNYLKYKWIKCTNQHKRAGRMKTCACMHFHFIYSMCIKWLKNKWNVNIYQILW